jgi:hypothetical protein
MTMTLRREGFVPALLDVFPGVRVFFFTAVYGKIPFAPRHKVP